MIREAREESEAPGDTVAPGSEEYPARVWPRFYVGVLGLLAVEIAIFAAITVWFR